MPCFLFTWHTYGSWLPDRDKGYVHWQRGLSKSSTQLAVAYREQQTHETAFFSVQHQTTVIEEVLSAASFQHFQVHFIACEATHVHVLASWASEKSATVLRRSLRHSLTQRLNQLLHRPWFSRGGDLKRVRNRAHFEHLYNRYLPSHSGMKWSAERGIYK